MTQLKDRHKNNEPVKLNSKGRVKDKIDGS